MAIATHINGRFIGKLGNTVSYMLRGKYVMRTIGKYNGKPSDKQLANFMAMKVSMTFLKAIKPFVNIGFGLEAIGTDKNAFNLATSYVKKQALKGEYPNLSVDYSKAVLAKGIVPVADETSMTKAVGGVWIKWSTDSNPPRARKGDSVMILVYCPEREIAFMVLNATKRSEGAYFFDLQKRFLNEPLEAYICFRQDDGKAVSDSMYVGNLNGGVESAQDIEDNKRFTETKQRLDVVEALYKQKIRQNHNSLPKDKAFRNLSKEYEVLKERLKNMPGKDLS